MRSPSSARIDCSATADNGVLMRKPYSSFEVVRSPGQSPDRPLGARVPKPVQARLEPAESRLHPAALMSVKHEMRSQALQEGRQHDVLSVGAAHESAAIASLRPTPHRRIAS